MNSKRLIIILSVLSLLTFSYCRDTETDENFSNQPYSISLTENSSRIEIEKFKSKLNIKLDKPLRIEKIKENRYVILYGNYKSSYDAGKEAYDLFANSIASNYKIFRNGKFIFDAYANVFFVGRYLERPSVFGYNIISKQSSIEWTKWGRKVISLNPYYDNSFVYITTALGYGKISQFPYVLEARLYKLKPEEDETTELIEFGDGTQLYTMWESDNSFKVNFTIIDTLNPRVVYQNIYTFEPEGNGISVKKREFDLLVDGFPIPPKRKPVFISPNQRFKIRTVATDNVTDIYIKDLDNNSEELILSKNKIINDIRWSEDGNYFFIVFNGKEFRNGSNKEIRDELIVIDAGRKKTIKTFTGYKYENLLVRGKLLFFDKRLEGLSQIVVYDYVNDKLIFTISTYGGCGLNNLPL